MNNLKPTDKNIGEIKIWLKRIIDSCDNTFHFEGAQILINKFKELCKKEDDWIEIQDYFNEKYNYMHGIIN